jgi:hypothetical protein
MGEIRTIYCKIRSKHIQIGSETYQKPANEYQAYRMQCVKLVQRLSKCESICSNLHIWWYDDWTNADIFLVFIHVVMDFADRWQRPRHPTLSLQTSHNVRQIAAHWKVMGAAIYGKLLKSVDHIAVMLRAVHHGSNDVCTWMFAEVRKTAVPSFSRII